MRIGGHVTATVFKRYDITSDQDLREARDRQSQFRHSQTAKVVFTMTSRFAEEKYAGVHVRSRFLRSDSERSRADLHVNSVVSRT